MTVDEFEHGEVDEFSNAPTQILPWQAVWVHVLVSMPNDMDDTDDVLVMIPSSGPTLEAAMTSAILAVAIALRDMNGASDFSYYVTCVQR